MCWHQQVVVASSMNSRILCANKLTWLNSSIPMVYISLINFGGNSLILYVSILNFSQAYRRLHPSSITTQILFWLLSGQVLDSDVGPSSSSASTATPPNGRNGRMLTPTSDDGEYVEYSFDSVSDMPYTEEDEDRVSYTIIFFGVVVISSHSCLQFLKILVEFNMQKCSRMCSRGKKNTRIES